METARKTCGGDGHVFDPPVSGVVKCQCGKLFLPLHTGASWERKIPPETLVQTAHTDTAIDLCLGCFG